MCAPKTPRGKPKKRAGVSYFREDLIESQGHDTGKWECLRRTAVKIAFWPASILFGIWDALSHVVYEEPSDYRAAPPENGALGDQSKVSCITSYGPKHVDRSRLILRRFVEAGRVSWTFLVQVLAYFGALHLMNFFSVPDLLHSFRGDAERLLALLTGTSYELRSGKKVPFSILGSLDTDLSLPYSPAEGFPFHSQNAKVNASRRAHRPSTRAAALASLLQGNDAVASPAETAEAVTAPCEGVPLLENSDSTAAALGKSEESASTQPPRKPRAAASKACMDVSPPGCEHGAHGEKATGKPCLGVAVPAKPAAATVDSPRNAHFLAACSKLIYEDERIVRDVIEHRWGMQYHRGQALHGRHNRSCWLPDIVWCACSNERAIIVMLKGADPLYQMDLRADPPCVKRHRPSMGEVHDGLWAGLHQPDPARPGNTVLDRFLALLTSAGRGKRVFLTGHSMGGALASYISLLLPIRVPGLERSVGGIFTFGAPRCGDAESARIIAELYPEKAFRYAHASDLVCQLPPAWGYQHHGLERYITSFPVLTGSGRHTRILRQEADPRTVRVAKAREDTWAYGYSVAKIGAGLRVPDESAMRLVMRVLLLAFPGFSDHLPCDYESALRHALTFEHDWLHEWL